MCIDWNLIRELLIVGYEYQFAEQGVGMEGPLQYDDQARHQVQVDRTKMRHVNILHHHQKQEQCGLRVMPLKIAIQKILAPPQ
jgi:hypothetical protein